MPKTTTEKTATKKATRANTTATPAKANPKASTKTKPAKNATQAKQATKGKTKQKGILDIAAEMIVKSKKPMGCKEIVEHAIEKGLWKTKGQTPSATLYAAIIREIAKKGKDARFKKVDRGLFTAAKTVLK